MLNRFVLILVVCVFSIYAAQKTPKQDGPEKAGGKQSGEVKADSMVYDQPTEWRVYSIDGPAKAFALQGDALWCATDGEVGIINMRGKKSDVQRFKTLGSMPAEGIIAIVIDRQGGVWFGGPNGVAQKSGTTFTAYSSNNGLSDNNVTSIAIGNDGGVWVGTEKGLNVYVNGSWKKYSTKDGLVSNKIQVLLADKKGTLWVGTNKGISIWKGAKWSSQTMKNGLSWNDVKALAHDSKTGLVWAAVGEKDVNSFNGQNWSVYMEIQQGITSIMVDTHSRIWFGSETGLIKFNGEEWISDPGKHGVPAAQVFQMYCDEGGNHWFANENGVLRMANPYPY
ncbi:MAG: hypothetical protein JXA71_00155 [Chitinispirillaceae bacterium]|nr:hypothetical protein [Chitinispirillaceae bacterium]